ncbi:hypothetical protein J9874_03832 (plasmid) [Duffyella gerundensis]|nr:hypothetical protein J9874_03832 [Duffyella gerundensis]
MAAATSSLIINSVHSILLVWTTEMGGETRTHRGQTYVRAWHRADDHEGTVHLIKTLYSHSEVVSVNKRLMILLWRFSN